ncbi:diacylglycerol/lipid kinase family protein [Serinicoccus profundi]|uniref:diacylglycerol/lipid kinase family protein n=1 Tax=Serinicoccus profundi TaxID=1078471 RepID=UPI000255E564|nr:diacylglycerol kinase family protein [Serinicoccus profundi]
MGGDGSIHRFLQVVQDQGLLGRIGTVGVVPLGTGNDLVRGAGIPLDPQEAARVAVAGATTERGLMVDDTGSVVVNVVHAGVAAEATAHAGEVKGVLGKAAYAWGALRAGLTSKGWHLRVSVDGEGIADDDRPALMVTLALGSSVGGGTPVAPHARADDGQVEVVVAHGVGPLPGSVSRWTCARGGTWSARTSPSPRAGRSWCAPTASRTPSGSTPTARSRTSG